MSAPAGSVARERLFRQCNVERSNMFRACAENRDSKSKRGRGHQASGQKKVVKLCKTKTWRSVTCFGKPFRRSGDTFSSINRMTRVLNSTFARDTAATVLRSRLANVVVTTSFSGIGLAEIGVAALAASVGAEVRFARAVEWDEHCRQVLMARSSCCVHGDVEDMLTSGGQLRRKVWCYKHQQRCSATLTLDSSAWHVELAGPPCPPWSSFGSRLGTADPRYKYHEAACLLKSGFSQGSSVKGLSEPATCAIGWVRPGLAWTEHS